MHTNTRNERDKHAHRSWLMWSDAVLLLPSTLSISCTNLCAISFLVVSIFFFLFFGPPSTDTLYVLRTYIVCTYTCCGLSSGIRIRRLYCRCRCYTIYTHVIHAWYTLILYVQYVACSGYVALFKRKGEVRSKNKIKYMIYLSRLSSPHYIIS